MKTLIISLLIIFAAGASHAQTVFAFNENTILNEGQFPNQCNNCEINIKSGVTLTLNMDVYLQNAIISGGNIVINSKKVTVYEPGATFNNINITFNGNAGLINSGAVKMNGSSFVFKNSSVATVYTSFEMSASQMKFIGSSNFVATGGNFNMKNNSTLVAGDGSVSNTAFIKFNGAVLNEYDLSSVTIANYNNYYFNWSSYNTMVNNKSVSTANSSINCNATGKHGCENPYVFGPATLNYGGVSNSAILPVKLSSFGAKLVDNTVMVTWTTEAETNAEKFEIERSADNNSWLTVGSVKAAGNSSRVSSYKFEDNIKGNSKMNYRLKMIDQDGATAYSPIRSVKLENSIALGIYPNPATEYIVINSKNGNADRLNVQLVTYTGQIITQKSGNGNMVISVSHLRAGQYIVKVTTDNGTSKSFPLSIK